MVREVATAANLAITEIIKNVVVPRIITRAERIIRSEIAKENPSKRLSGAAMKALLTSYYQSIIDMNTDNKQNFCQDVGRLLSIPVEDVYRLFEKEWEILEIFEIRIPHHQISYYDTPRWKDALKTAQDTGHAFSTVETVRIDDCYRNMVTLNVNTVVCTVATSPTG